MAEKMISKFPENLVKKILDQVGVPTSSADGRPYELFERIAYLAGAYETLKMLFPEEDING